MAKMVIKRVGVLSWAKLTALAMAVMGLIIGVIYGLALMVFGAAMMSVGRSDTAGAAVGGVVAGLAVMIMAPIFYGVLGFVLGAIYAAVYNVAAGIVGGLELELESASDEYAAPPPPVWEARQYETGQQPPRY